MKFLLTLIALFLSFNQTAKAVTVDIEAGDYFSRHYFGGYFGADQSAKADFKIARKGNQFRLIDEPNNLIYAIDFDNAGEQDINAKYLQFLRENPIVMGGAFSRILKRATVSDIRATSDPTKTLLNINLYLEVKSIFGSLTAKIQIENSLTAKKCPVKVYSYTNNMYKEDQAQTTCIFIQPAADVRLVELNTGLADELNKGLGLVLDTVVRIISINFSSPIHLFERP